MDQQTSMTMYKTLILPVFDYCDFMYYGIGRNDKKVLQSLQNCALKTVLKVDRLTSTESVHQALNIDTLDT